MKKTSAIYAGAALGILAILIATQIFDWSATAQKSVSVQWEYAAITAVYLAPNTETQAIFNGAANICYLQANGCRNEEVRGELVYNKFLQDFRLENSERSKAAGLNQAKDVAFAKAVAKLGAEGWEMTEQPSLQFDTFVPNNQNGFNWSPGEKELKQDVYFRRVRQ